jgi:effector-binding domain-containing protein
MVVTIRRRGAYSLIPALIMEACEYAFASGAGIVGAPMLLLHETSMEAAQEADRLGTADVQIAVPVGKQVQGKGDIVVTTLPGGRMAKTVHKGPYETSGTTYVKLFAWLKEKGFTVTGPIREIYLNDPRQVPSEEILTEIYVPVG